MKHMAALSREEREELFFNTAHKVGMPPAIVEKDFWVCSIAAPGKKDLFLKAEPACRKRTT